MSATPNLDRAWLESRRRADQAYEQRDALAMVEHETRADLVSAQRDLAGYARRLAHRMDTLAQRLETETAGAPNDGQWLNSLGEIQGAALDVDRLCAQIATMRKVLQGIASARKASAREGA